MAQNPYYVDPMGGYGPSIVKGIGGIAKGYREQQAEEQAQAAQDAQNQEMQAAFDSGDPNQVGSFLIKNPGRREDLIAAMGHRDDATKANMAQTISTALANPAKAPQIIQARIDALRAVYGDDTNLDDSLEAALEAKDDPAAFANSLEMMGHVYLEESVMKAYSEKRKPAEAPKGTANIKDWNHYQTLLQQDPVKAEMFARQVGITKTAESPLKPTTAMQNYEKWSVMGEGPERKAFGRMIGIDPKEKPEDALKRFEKMESVVQEIENSDAVVTMAGDLLGNQGYIDAITGIRGATPFSVPGTAGYDAMVAFEQLKDNLTLENLNKMSGVLTDKDIQILASAGAGLKAGMSEKAMRAQLNKIRDVLIKKSARQRGKLEALGYKPEQPSKPIGDMTDDELMKQAFGAK
jgi:hypothetical protein